MANINEILQRAASLRDETALNSISPERAGGIMYDTLIALNELWLQQGSALVISKIYASVSAMEADTAPVSDLTGQPLRPGQIVVIASSDSDNGTVYRYNGTTSPSWTSVGKIGNLEPVDSLDSDSTSLPLAAHQGKVLDGKISQLGQEVGNINDGFILIPKDGLGSGYYADDLSVAASSDYRHYTIDVSSYAGNRVRLRAGNSQSNGAYFASLCHLKLADNTIIHLHQNTTYVTYEKDFVYVDLPINADTLYLSWKTGSVSSSVLPMFAYEPLDDDIKRIDGEIGQSYFDIMRGEYPVLPSQLFLQSDKKVPLYKNSLIIEPGHAKNIDINIIAKPANGFERKIYELKEPSYFGNDDFAQSAKFYLQRVNDFNHLYYKDIKIFHKDVNTLNGKTIKVLSLGDSLTQGADWNSTPVTMLAQDLSAYGVTLQYVGSLVRTYTNNDSQQVQIRYEGRGGWRYRTFVGMESKFVSRNVIIPSETQHEWVEGVDGTIDEIKANNAWLYPATAQDLVDNPDFCFHFVSGSTVENKSYAEDASLGTYYIFDPVRYFSERNIDIPDIVTIALGTNEWYLGSSFYGGFDNAKATACAEFMIKQFRKVSANLKIVVIPLNNFPISRQGDWEQYCMPLCANVILVCDNIIKAGDTKLFVCPIYAQGSRWLAYNDTEGAASAVSSINDLQKIGIDNNVHMLYRYDDSNYDYRDSLLACILNLID